MESIVLNGLNLQIDSSFPMVHNKKKAGTIPLDSQ